jgi:hypothetical protein
MRRSEVGPWMLRGRTIGTEPAGRQSEGPPTFPVPVPTNAAVARMGNRCGRVVWQSWGRRSQVGLNRSSQLYFSVLPDKRGLGAGTAELS